MYECESGFRLEILNLQSFHPSGLIHLAIVCLDDVEITPVGTFFFCEAGAAIK